jgi:hypothetical protein
VVDYGGGRGLFGGKVRGGEAVVNGVEWFGFYRFLGVLRREFMQRLFVVQWRMGFLSPRYFFEGIVDDVAGPLAPRDY